MNELIIGSEYAKKVIPLIKEAKQTIAIIVFDWRWYPDYVGYPIHHFNLEVLQAAKRGVKVCAITNYKEITELLAKSQIQCKHLLHNKLVHTKMVVIDGKIAVVGSHNFTHSAFSHNHEISVIMHDPEIAQELLRFFNHLWQ